VKSPGHFLTKAAPLHLGILAAVLIAVVSVGTHVVGNSRAATVTGDINLDGMVNIFDLSTLLAHWGTNDAASDINASGLVDTFDLSILLSNWGKTGTTPTPIASATATPTAAPTSTPSTGPSGEAMPLGDLPGWKQNLAEDFKTTASSSAFDSTYSNSWCGYDDGTGGKYYKSAISAHDGIMDFTLDGTKGAAGSYGPPATCWGGTYGRYSIRFKAIAASGNGTAMMLWPSSNVWGDGEIDYPEGNFNDQIHVYHHGIGCTDCSSSDGFDTGAGWYQWHTATTEWLPTGVKYYLDGTLIKTVTHDIPTTIHRWTLQVAPNGGNQAGNLQIDWVASWTKI
jgi:hypothetical protein